MKISISLETEDINNIQLLLILWELLENEENNDLWNIATEKSIEWLQAEIREGRDRMRQATDSPLYQPRWKNEKENDGPEENEEGG